MTPALILAALLGAAAPAPPPGGEQVLPFIGRGMLDWQATGDDSLYVRGYNGRWYLVRTTNRCPRLRAALSVGFVTSALDQLDRHAAILVEGDRCPVASVTFAPGPPPSKHPDRR